MAIKILSLFIWMIGIPICMGYVPVLLFGKNREEMTPAFVLPAGMIFLWAVFQIITVPFVLLSGNFRKIIILYDITFGIISFVGLFLLWKNRRELKEMFLEYIRELRTRKIWLHIIWFVFLISLLFQLYQSYSLAYADGDDSYYLSIATAADLGGTMYVLDPYTGTATTLDVRHGLAPFPIWIAYIADKCGVNVAVAAHSLIPLILIPMTYLLYYVLAQKLCKKKKEMIPVFLLFVSLLQIFGNYSIYPASTFLLTRTRQGKEALGNIILVFLLILLFKMEYWIKQKRYGKMILWLILTGTAGCLCSTMASFLVLMSTMLAAVLLMITLRDESLQGKKWFLGFQWRFFVASLVGCAPCFFFALLYFLLK